RWGGFLEDIDKFDPAFFNILPRDAGDIDPQERLFLETCWDLLDRAGYLSSSTHETLTGVFAGVMYGSYGRLAATGWARGRLSGAHSAYWSVANRVSYHFDFQGPSFAVDSACSSSLTAVHLAVESLRRGECEMALAGGVNVAAHPQKYLQLAQGRFLSDDGRCRSFGAGGTGYVPGEGVGAVLLKPLAKAEADGDHIYGVIRATRLNHTGRTSGFTVPSPTSQAALIRDALDAAGLPPSAIGYLEAHGTGTALGDPVEINGLARAFAGTGAGTCAIGSVKSNLGHLEAAAGLAGLSKVLLELRHRRLVPSLHAEQLNPDIDWARSPFAVQCEAAPWPVRRAADGTA
ncbi:beta-ketoacyl [acyl carrier protein] synthase domain-containing protein, partial [Nocardia sp. NPDC003354]